MNTRTIVIISILALAGSFALGRYLSPEKTKTVTSTVEVEKIVVQTVHSVTKIIERPDGTKETVIVANTKTDSKTNEESQTDSKEVTKSKDKLIISVLAGMQLPLNGQLIYGAEISKNLLGPLRMGLFAMTDRKVGISLGLEL